MEATTSAGEREFDRGQFGWVQFAVTPDVLDDIEEAFDGVDDIMRHLLVRIDEKAVGGRNREEDEDGQKDTEAKSTDDDEVPPEEQGDESGKDDDEEDDQ